MTSIPTSSQAHMIASNSDDLFYPTSAGPSMHPYTLPAVPIQDLFLNCAYISPSCQHPRPSHIPVNREHLSHPPFQPPHYSSTSYNNPSFIIPLLHAPPLPPIHQFNPQLPQLGPLPPVPFHTRPQLYHPIQQPMQHYIPHMVPPLHVPICVFFCLCPLHPLYLFLKPCLLSLIFLFLQTNPISLLGTRV